VGRAELGVPRVGEGDPWTNQADASSRGQALHRPGCRGVARIIRGPPRFLNRMTFRMRLERTMMGPGGATHSNISDRNSAGRTRGNTPPTEPGAAVQSDNSSPVTSWRLVG
jgi:hypothetical protein